MTHDDPDMAALQRDFDALVAERRAAVPRERAHAEEVARLRAKVEMLRGVGCAEDGDGPCGACLKCARRERDEAYAEAHREAQSAIAAWDRAHAANAQRDAALAELRDVVEAIGLPWAGAADVGGGVRLALQHAASEGAIDALLSMLDRVGGDPVSLSIGHRDGTAPLTPASAADELWRTVRFVEEHAVAGAELHAWREGAEAMRESFAAPHDEVARAARDRALDPAPGESRSLSFGQMNSARAQAAAIRALQLPERKDVARG